jgi:hypothetical protein
MMMAIATPYYSVKDSWPQVNGGVRYLVVASDGVEITVDADTKGRLSGFVRGLGLDGPDENARLKLAWDAVRAIRRPMPDAFYP